MCMVCANLSPQALLSFGGGGGVVPGEQVGRALASRPQFHLKQLTFHLFYILGLGKRSFE